MTGTANTAEEKNGDVEVVLPTTSALLEGDDWSEESDEDADYEMDVVNGTGNEKGEEEEEEEEELGGSATLASSSTPSQKQGLGIAPEKTFLGPYALHDACEAGDVEAIKTILAPIIAARQSDGDFDPTQNILVDVDTPDDEGCTPLHCALFSRNIDAVRACIDGGADVGIGCEGSPVAHLSVCAGAVGAPSFAANALSLVLSAGASVASRDSVGNTALHVAAAWGDVKCAEIVLNADASVLKALDRAGRTALDLACARARKDIFDLLLRHGAYDSNDSAPAAFSELHACAKNRFSHGVLSLIERGADAQAKDAQGLTALDWWVRCAESALDADGEQADGAFAALGGTGKHISSPSAGKTQILWHPVCMEHHTCRPSAMTSRLHVDERPNENPNRLHVLLDPDLGILKSRCLSDRVAWSVTQPAKFVDILRVHDFHYVRALKQLCESIPAGGEALAEIDGDTTISRKSFSAAMHAAGSVCNGVDILLCDDAEKKPRNVFCAVRPPGHHAGPRGRVTCEDDPLGSFGFCLFSNAAIGAAYARCVYRHKGIKKVAIIDFDVHHGNGTEECIRNLKPNMVENRSAGVMGDTNFCDVVTRRANCKPWLDETDSENVFFASIHGWGARSPGFNPKIEQVARTMGRFYPASGDTCSVQPILNVGQNSSDRLEWRKSWLERVLPALHQFDPDMIFICAGFDAHAEDDINFGYVSALEEDYAWLTERLVRIANTCCEGRIVSVLEGGYKIQGKIVSPFARSVYAHVDALASTSAAEKWSDEEAKWETNYVPIAKAETTQESAASTSTADNNGGAAAKSGGSHTLPPVSRAPRRPRRKRAAVDYVALNEKLNAERAAKRSKQEADA